MRLAILVLLLVGMLFLAGCQADVDADVDVPTDDEEAPGVFEVDNESVDELDIDFDASAYDY